jgi:hypothetical protein
LAAGPPLLTRRLGAAAAPESGLINAAGFGLKQEEPSDSVGALVAQKAKEAPRPQSRNLSVEHLLTRRATQVIVSRDLAAYAYGKLTARRASPG